MGQVRNVTRTDLQVFDTWITGKGGYSQYIFKDIDFRLLCERNQKTVKRTMLIRYKHLKNDLQFLRFYFNNYFQIKNFEEEIDLFLKKMDKLYLFMQKDIGLFLQHFIDSGLAQLVIDREERDEEGMDSAMDRYIALMRLFCSDRLLLNERQYLFTLANNFFDYCFSQKTFPQFKKLLNHRRYHPIARLLYSTMWKHLAGDGWKEWHQSCLNNLQDAASAGKKITYIAGGCDIYQLIKNGIYTIHIIDPMLPTQPAYYTDHWSWFVEQGVVGNEKQKGDRLIFTFDGEDDVYMERVEYKQRGFFTFTDDEKTKHKIPKSVTKWSVICNKSQVGIITFERRFCVQKDFDANQNEQLLISFNELYYITCTSEPDHWNIFPKKLKKNFSILVKQLRDPLGKQVVQNMEKADSSSLEFIRLGTCAVADDEED